MTAAVGTRKAAAVAFPIIIAIVTALFAVSYLVSLLLGLPYSVTLPLPVTGLGAALVVLGLAFAAWTFSQRNPASVIVSTYVTFVKAIRRTPPAERAGRVEPLVVSGPQRYTRNPLYFGVIVTVLGWALWASVSYLFVASVVLSIWFGLVLIPFEERELRALFGEEWRKYSEEVPMLIPFTKTRKRPPAS